MRLSYLISVPHPALGPLRTLRASCRRATRLQRAARPCLPGPLASSDRAGMGLGPRYGDEAFYPLVDGLRDQAPLQQLLGTAEGAITLSGGDDVPGADIADAGQSGQELRWRCVDVHELGR